MTRELALCADDFGHSAAVDRAILHLAGRGRLSETSCMVNLPAWPADAHTLATLPAVAAGRVRAGLHLNLTEGRPLSPALARLWPNLPALPRLIALAHLRRLPMAGLADELQAQFDAFENAFGAPPAHLDGHQHVHHLPGLRDLLLCALAARPGLRARHTGRVDGPGFRIKRRLIQGTGGTALGRRLQALGRQANDRLLGVYDFVDRDYRSLMQRWLAALPARGGLIFCHPGEPGGAPDDAIAAARARELSYLDSADFAADLAAAGVRLVRTG
jgi:predicted glycoside hydrolase/deacetylase ChbG (UPF0249 family)